MQVKRWAIVATIGAVLVLSGCKQDKIEETYHPSTLEESGEDGILRVRLDARAAERIGLQTVAVREDRAGAHQGLVVPYGAILYDTQGDTWTFTNPEPLLYVRHKVKVEHVDGDQVVLSEGPPAGTAVVIVGATELMGAEHKYGH